MQCPLEEFDWAGLKIVIPSQDVRSMTARLDRIAIREFADGTKYYKLKSWKVGIAMTPAQTKALREELHARVDTAERRVAAYHDEQIDARKDKGS